MVTAFLDHPGPLAFAHRGGAAYAPENSWRAFEHAVSLGYRYLETDVQATADGVALAFHDRSLARVTGQPGRVAKVAYRDLADVLIDGTEPIPRLEDLLTAWPDLRFNLDVKDAPAILPLAEVLRRTNAWDRVCIVSFSAARLWATRRVLARPVCMAASPLGTAVVRFGSGRTGRPDHSGPGRAVRGTRPAPRPGTVGAILARASARQRGQAGPSAVLVSAPPAVEAAPATAAGPATLPAPTIMAVPAERHGAVAVRLARAGVKCVQVPGTLATPALIARAHSLGLQIHVWTVNDTASMEQLLDLGVDGVMTDDTVALREVLSARGQWHPRVS
jgi:glycerophosphoryl diester phosphodiesterase